MKRDRNLNQIGVFFVTCLLIFLSSKIAIADTYYIDYVKGLDSNNGTTTSTPWKFAPEMPGFTGTYSHSAGDVFVFKGGVTWPMQSGYSTVLSIKNSGANGTPDVYMGGQQCGYTPATPFVRCSSDSQTQACGSNASVSCNDGSPWGIGYPTFTSNNSISAGYGINMSAGLSYITIDGIRVYNVGYTDGTGFGINGNSTSSLEVKNCVLNTNAVDAFNHNIGNSTVNGGYTAHLCFYDNLIENSGRVVINQSDNVSYSDDTQIYNNIFMGRGTYNNHSYHTDGIMIGTNTFQNTGNWMTNVKIHHNIFRGDWGASAAIYMNGASAKIVTPTSNPITAGFTASRETYWALGLTSGAYGEIQQVTSTTLILNTIAHASFIPGEIIQEQTYNGSFTPSAGGTIEVTMSSTTPTTYYFNSINGALIYDNVIAPETCIYGIPFSPAAIAAQSGQFENISIYNNTIAMDACIANPPTGIYLEQVNDATIENNIFSATDNSIIMTATCSGTIVADYDIYNTALSEHLIWDNRTSNRYNTLAACQNAGYEAHGINNSSAYSSKYIGFVTIPTGDNTGNWQLQSSSPAKDVGVNLSSLFTTDYLNETISTWGMGAYNYEADLGGKTQYALLIISANGIVTSNPSGINCGSTCSANYAPETSVTLTASANNGYTFTGWSGGGCAGTGICTVTMTAATPVTANYAITTNNLTVTKSGTGVGTVTGSDGLINCGSTCSVNYESGKSVTLTALANNGSIFSGWSGGGCSGTGTCTVTMTAATSVAATFIPVYNLTVTKSVTGAGTITSSDSTINCGSTCSANYDLGTSETLTASATSGYTFTGWLGGGCSGTGTCTVSMTAATSVTATFAITTYNLTVTKSGTGTGTVTGSDGLINCGSTCSVNYESGKSVALTALANSESTLSGWSGGGCSGTGTCTVTMTVAKSVAATFARSMLYSKKRR